jgi:rhodanese-related sulfurtransferase
MRIKRDSRYIGIAALFVVTSLFLNAFTGILVSKILHAGEGPAKTQIEVKNISAKQAKELIEEGNEVFILDVRTREEYNEFHMKGANLIPIQELEQNISKIPKDKKVIVHCAKGKRSATACEILKNKGLKELYNVEGGINQWKSEGYPVEKPE